MKIKENLAELLEGIPSNVSLVAVSKTKSAAEIMEAYEAGQRAFGENKAQELQTKYQVLPKDIQWHFIGHLQTNKVKYIASFIHMVESADSLKILEELDNAGKRYGRTICCLLQFHIATEETKFGLDMNEAKEILRSDSFLKMKHISLSGVMGMASFTQDVQLIRHEFNTLHGYFRELKQQYFLENHEFSVISMGMSGDYRIAIEEGSTMVRIGSAIFGERKPAG